MSVATASTTAKMGGYTNLPPVALWKASGEIQLLCTAPERLIPGVTDGGVATRPLARSGTVNVEEVDTVSLSLLGRGAGKRSRAAAFEVAKGQQPPLGGDMVAAQETAGDGLTQRPSKKRKVAAKSAQSSWSKGAFALVQSEAKDTRVAADAGRTKTTKTTLPPREKAASTQARTETTKAASTQLQTETTKATSAQLQAETTKATGLAPTGNPTSTEHSRPTRLRVASAKAQAETNKGTELAPGAGKAKLTKHGRSFQSKTPSAKAQSKTAKATGLASASQQNLTKNGQSSRLEVTSALQHTAATKDTEQAPDTNKTKPKLILKLKHKPSPPQPESTSPEAPSVPYRPVACLTAPWREPPRLPEARVRSKYDAYTPGTIDTQNNRSIWRYPKTKPFFGLTAPGFDEIVRERVWLHKMNADVDEEIRKELDAISDDDEIVERAAGGGKGTGTKRRCADGEISGVGARSKRLRVPSKKVRGG